MTPDQAGQIRTEHDAYVRYLTRQNKTALAGLYRTEQLHQGMILVSGGPQSKDELIGALIDARYPQSVTDEMTHVLYHKSGENWSACQHCQRQHQEDTMTCQSPDHADEIELFGCCDTCGTFASQVTVCGRCGQPAHKVADATEDGQPVEIWHHDSVADDVFCGLVMHAADRAAR